MLFSAAAAPAAGATPTVNGRAALLAMAALAVACAPARGLKVVKQLGPCSVQTDQGTIDLSALSQGRPPRFANTSSNSYPRIVYYDWNPCKDFSEPEVGTDLCQSIALCAVLPPTLDESTTYLPYGNQASANFTVVSGQLTLSYSSASAGTVATVVLQCNPSARDTLVCTNDDNYQTIAFQYTGPSACYGHSSTGSQLSIGTVLCIALVACLVGYFVLGVLFMKFVKKSEKRFPVPNTEFWIQLPVYVKDGFAYGVTHLRCRRPGYTDA